MKNRSIPHVNTSLQSQTTSGSNLLQVDTANHILYIILFDGPIKRQVTQRTSPVNLHVLLATREATERAWVCDGTQHNMQIPNGSGPGAKESPILLAVGGCSVLKANCTTGVKDFHWPANGLLQTAVSLQVHLRINVWRYWHIWAQILCGEIASRENYTEFGLNHSLHVVIRFRTYWKIHLAMAQWSG